MKRNQSGEDYLEAILLLSRELEFVHRIDVARRMNVSQPAVQKAINILINGGYIRTDGMHIYFTEKGKEYAESVYARHCTIRRFLSMHGVSEQTADADACEIEHVISEETFLMMKNYISAAQVDKDSD